MIAKNKFLFKLIFLLVLASILKVIFNVITHFFFVDNNAEVIHNEIINWILRNIFLSSETVEPISKLNRGSGDSV